jgi:hypothetical protein
MVTRSLAMLLKWGQDDSGAGSVRYERYRPSD